MNKKLLEKIELLEEEFDVQLMTVEEVQEFLKSDFKFMSGAFQNEINIAEKHKDSTNVSSVNAYIDGLKQGLFLARQWYDIRIDEGF